MPNDANSLLWQGIEQLQHGAVASAWRGVLNAAFPWFAGTLLVQIPDRANCIPCPHGCGCAHEVIADPDGQLWAVCQCESWNCDDLRVSADDLVLWRLHRERLARSLALALGVESRQADIGLPGTHQIGCWSADAVPVWLSLSQRRRDFQQAVADLCARSRKRFILLTATSDYWDARTEELLERNGARCFSLARELAFTAQGRFQCRLVPGELFAEFAPEPNGKGEEQSAKQLFALIRQLDDARELPPPSLLSVLRLHCVEGHSTRRVAQMCRCAKTTVLRRLRTITARTRMSVSQLRALSVPMGALPEAPSDSRPRHIHGRSLIYDSEEEEDA